MAGGQDRRRKVSVMVGTAATVGRDRFAVVRIYDLATAGPGRRVLVDRLWPRGISRDRAGIDE